jgi:hypothetical protein
LSVIEQIFVEISVIQGFSIIVEIQSTRNTIASIVVRPAVRKDVEDNWFHLKLRGAHCFDGVLILEWND